MIIFLMAIAVLFAAPFLLTVFVLNDDRHMREMDEGGRGFWRD